MRPGIDMWIDDAGATAWNQMKGYYTDVRDLLIERHGEEYVARHPELVTGYMQALELRTQTMVLEHLLDDVLRAMKGMDVEMVRKEDEDAAE